MVSKDTTFESLSPINSAGEDSDTEMESERKRQAPGELPKAKGKSTKKWRRTFDVGEPSEASLQPEPKGREKPVKELIKKKSVLEILKILRDRINRQIKNDQIADMKSYIWLLSSVIQHQLSSLSSPIVKSRDDILNQWPARSDLNGIKMYIKAMEKKERDKAKLPAYNDEMKMKALPGLEYIELKIKSSVDERLKYSAKTDKLAETFLTEGVSTETLREKCSKAFPWLFREAGASYVPDVDQFQSLQTREECTVKDMEDLEKEHFDEDNIEVNVSDFCGFQDANNAAEVYIPDHLKPFEKKIEDDRGERTPANKISTASSPCLCCSERDGRSAC